jgi:hypothetical protein
MTSKLLLATLALGLTAGAALADGSIPPSNIPVPERGRTPADFAPPGWQFLQAAAGDLDGDGIADAAIAFSMERPGQKVRHPYGSRRGYDAVTGVLEEDAKPMGRDFRRTRMQLAPLVAKVPEEGAWPGPELALGPADARFGSAPAQGSRDVAARVSAVTMNEGDDGEFLEVRVAVEDDDVQAGDGIRLVTRDRKALPPLEMKRELAPGGWVVRARWSVTRPWMGEALFTERPVEQPPFGRAAELAVEVVDQDGGQSQDTVLSTGLEGRSGASLLLLDVASDALSLEEMLIIRGC